MSPQPCHPLPMYCRVPQMVWARSPHRRCRERPKSASLRCPAGRDGAWGPQQWGVLTDGVSPQMGCPHPNATDPYPSHPGGCSPSETNQALGWPICTRGCRDPPPDHPLSPPKPLCHPPSRLCARCPGRGDTLGTRRSHQCRGSPPHAVPSATPVAPSGRLPPPGGLSPPSTHPAPAPARQQTGGRWPRRSARRRATARAGPRCCSRCTLPGHGTGLVTGTEVTRAPRPRGRKDRALRWYECWVHTGSEVAQAPGPCGHQDRVLRCRGLQSHGDTKVTRAPGPHGLCGHKGGMSLSKVRVPVDPKGLWLRGHKGATSTVAKWVPKRRSPWGSQSHQELHPRGHHDGTATGVVTQEK